MKVYGKEEQNLKHFPGIIFKDLLNHIETTLEGS